MANRGGFTADGRHFADTLFSSARGTPLHRFFIDGKPVSRATWQAEAAKAKAADAARKAA